MTKAAEGFSREDLPSPRKIEQTMIDKAVLEGLTASEKLSSTLTRRKSGRSSSASDSNQASPRKKQRI